MSYFYTPAFYDARPTVEKWCLSEHTANLYKKGFAFDTEKEAQIQAEKLFKDIIPDDEEQSIFPNLSPSEQEEWEERLNNKLLEEYRKHPYRVIKSDIILGG